MLRLGGREGIKGGFQSHQGAWMLDCENDQVEEETGELGEEDLAGLESGFPGPATLRIGHNSSRKQLSTSPAGWEPLVGWGGPY